MKTFLVRTRADQALVGVFCADSVPALGEILKSMVDPQDCEYLTLKANEGLFVEAQFVHVPAQQPGQRDSVFLTNAPQEFMEEASDDEDQEEEDALAGKVAPGSALAAAMAEVIQPVLEPTEVLATRLQSAEVLGGWQPVSSATPTSTGALPAPAIRLLVSGSARHH